MNGQRYRVEVAARKHEEDVDGVMVRHDLADAGLTGIHHVRSVRVYEFNAAFPLDHAVRLAREFLADSVLEDFAINRPLFETPAGGHVLDIGRKPGVMEPAEASVRRGAKRLGLPVEQVRVGRRFVVSVSPGVKLDRAALGAAAYARLANAVVETVQIDGEGAGRAVSIRRSAADASDASDAAGQAPRVETVPLRDLDDGELLELSRRGMLSLNLAEMRTVQRHFAERGRDPYDIELETIAQTWSEHCGHKTFRGLIRYRDENGREEVIDSLFKTTIAKATKETAKDWCWSVFEDNAGVIDFDGETGLAFKVETHNHPSAIEPYGGAGTGSGGCIRDPMGTGLGGKPILNTDVFCLGPPDWPKDQVPAGALHPARVLRGVVAGVRDYGNRMGIPTGNGALWFDPRYIGNPLVFCGCLAVIPKAAAKRRRPAPGMLGVVVGGRTGRDGIHGATFSSVELTENSGETSSGAVQIGNPIEQKKTLDFLMRARDAGLYHAITDCGAGGLSSALGEMGEDTGVAVDLDKVPLKYQGLTPAEIWISEAQERMVIAVEEKDLPALQAIADEEEVEMVAVARFTDDHLLRLFWQGRPIGEMPMAFLHDGDPRDERLAVWSAPDREEPKTAALSLPSLSGGAAAWNEELTGLLGRWTICSKENIVRQYDHEVQARTALRPFVGIANDGPGDAVVVTPIVGKPLYAAVSCGLAPSYSDIDPYWMAAAAIDEAIRNLVAVGASLDRCAILDNFCWGDCNKPDRLAGLVRASRACYDFAVAYGTPFISGKDSLNNEFSVAGQAVAIPGTLLVSALALLPEGAKPVSMDLKASGNHLYIVGMTRDELGGSQFYQSRGLVGANVPKVDAATNLKGYLGLSKATAAGLVRSLHDCSEGGFAVAMAEMAFAGGVGASVDVGLLPTDAEGAPASVAGTGLAALLFGESQGRLIAEVAPEREAEFKRILTESGAVFADIGRTTTDTRLRIAHHGRDVVDANLAELKRAWQAPLAPELC